MQGRRRWMVVPVALGLTLGASLVAEAYDRIDAPATSRFAAYRVAPPPIAPVAPELRGLYELVLLVNAERAARGLPALLWHAEVAAAAQAHSVDMAARRRMLHAGSDGSDAGDRLRRAGFDWTSWGEDIGAGFVEAAPLFAAWMGSAGHERQLMGNFRYVGVGAAVASDGTPYWTLDVANGS